MAWFNSSLAGNLLSISLKLNFCKLTSAKILHEFIFLKCVFSQRELIIAVFEGEVQTDQDRGQAVDTFYDQDHPETNLGLLMCEWCPKPFFPSETCRRLPQFSLLTVLEVHATGRSGSQPKWRRIFGAKQSIGEEIQRNVPRLVKPCNLPVSLY